MVRAVDPRLQRDALGAVVTVTCGDRVQRAPILAGWSYASSNEPIAHFGLGASPQIDFVTVRWPDGLEERFDGVMPGRVTLERGTGRVLDAAQ